MDLIEFKRILTELTNRTKGYCYEKIFAKTA